MKKSILKQFGLAVALSFTFNSVAQTCVPDASYTGSDTRPSTVGSNAAAPDGQSFRCGHTGLLSKVSFDLSATNVGCTQDSIEVVISVLNGDTLDAALMVAETFKVPANFTRTMDTFTFVNPALIYNGSMYTLTIVMTAGQDCGSNEPDLTWYFEFPTNYWAGTGAVQYQDGVITSLGNTQYFGTCIGSAAGLEANSASFELALYPNPSSDQITVAVSNNELLEIAIVNTLGAKVFSTDASGAQALLNLNNLTTGIYYVQVTTTQGTATQKIVKK